MAPTTDNACLACAQKKRKCDRAVPTCSTCQRLRRYCFYSRTKLDLTGSAATFTPLESYSADQDGMFYHSVQRARLIDAIQGTLAQVAGTQQANRACLSCKMGKRRCDKQLPSCTRCTKLQIRCVYSSGMVAIFDHEAAVSYFAGSLFQQRVDAEVSLPIPKQKHTPMLLHSFLETFGMAPLPVEDGSLASLLRTDWVSKALADPCFLHATLFSASAHLDAFQRRSNNHVTTYHYTMALRLLREKLDSPGGMFDVGTIACIPPLVFFSSMRSDEQSSRIHREGLMQLLRAKGGLQNMGLDGFFSALIAVCVMTEAIVFDLDLAIPGVEVPATPLTPPAGLLTAALKRAARQTGYYNLPRGAITILQDISLVCKFSDARYVGTTDERRLYGSTKAKWRDRLQRKISQGLDVPDKTHPSTPNGIFQSCHAAALLFWYHFDIYFSVDATTLEALVQTLKSALVKASMDTWIRCSPEAHTWICLVGAVATTPYSDDRVWFSLRHGQPVSCLRSEGPSLYLESWKTYDWLNRRRKLRLKC